jgi:hypothetical protein
MRRSVVSGALSFVLSWACAGVLWAQDAAPLADDTLGRRARALAGAPLDEHAKTALEQAEQALEREAQARASGDVPAAERAARIADAALTLAERRSALARERAMLRSAGERRRGLDERTRAAKAARDHEQKRLGELQRGNAATAAPAGSSGSPR